MASLKAIRRRIASVKNTQQITKAMKMVSAAKLRRAQEAVEAARPYAEKMQELLVAVEGGVSTEAHPLLRPVENVQRVGLVLVAADRGLCGPYNASLMRRTEQYLRENADTDVALTIVGKKGVEYFRRRSVTIAERFMRVPSPSMEFAHEIVAPLTERFVSGNLDRVDVLYATFRSALSQVPTVRTLLPVSAGEEEESSGGTEPPREYRMEPEAEALLARLVPQSVEVRVYQALLEAQASEHGARMTAMDSATRNAGDMIDQLTLDMNRARQAQITTELMEIISGAEALRG